MPCPGSAAAPAQSHRASPELLTSNQHDPTRQPPRAGRPRKHVLGALVNTSRRCASGRQALRARARNTGGRQRGGLRRCLKGRQSQERENRAGEGESSARKTGLHGKRKPGSDEICWPRQRGAEGSLLPAWGGLPPAPAPLTASPTAPQKASLAASAEGTTAATEGHQFSFLTTISRSSCTACCPHAHLPPHQMCFSRFSWGKAIRAARHHGRGGAHRGKFSLRAAANIQSSDRGVG